ncbi:hypothetical protein T265_11021 [Opisthorchis viverrini]|uniref:Uncharacterized protein n=1 Tax=Opisthorchis viverrini TaxID=6198 RepID=A0A074ZYZ7_OPIVI|nr:hypothetical protein T265_11021 [Opisthorchis viverrini]KER20419.1 hypothetical protein T265_11021 [Opisthorchis viverrini]
MNERFSWIPEAKETRNRLEMMVALSRLPACQVKQSSSKLRSAVAPFRCLTAMLREGWDTVRLLKSRQGKLRDSGRVRTTNLPARWPKWLEREFTDRKVRGSNPTSATQLPLPRLGQPGSISALVLPSGGMAARHRKGATAERFLSFCNATKRYRG